MSYTKLNFPIILSLALSLIACFTPRQVAARHLLQMNLLDPPSQLGFPALPAPFLNKPPGALTFPAFQEPLIPPHFFPLLPFPNMPNVPLLPTPTGPSFSSLPAGPIPGIPSSVPPSFPMPGANLLPENPSTTPNMNP